MHDTSASASASASEPRAVLVVGPPSRLTGGMSTVVGQCLGLDLSPGYCQHFLPVTMSGNPRESRVSRVRRHVAQALKFASRARRASIVHLHTCSGVSFWRSLADVALARTLGCATVMHVHGARFDAFHQRSGPLRRRWIRAGLERADVVIALSASWRRSLERIAPRAHVRVIENAVAPHVSVTPVTSRTAGTPGSPGSPGTRRGVSGAGLHGPTRFLFLGRMDTWKGIDDLLDAAAILARDGTALRLVLAGPGGSAGDADALTRKIAARGLDAVVRAVGEVRGASKDRWLEWAQVYVQASHHEGMPISVLEAMACALPVVATRVGALPEVITPDVHGLLVAPRDPAALASAMRRLATDPAGRDRMGTAARRLAASRFSLARLREDLIHCYEACVKYKAASRRSRLGSETHAGTRLSPLPDGRGSVQKHTPGRA